MAKTDYPKTIMMLDDEMYNLTWLLDYLYSKGYDIAPASTANASVDLIDGQVYRAAIIDLNVPLLPPLDTAAAEVGEVYVKYPGLFVARRARNKGYRDRQVVIYSVHRDDAVSEEAKKLGCTYILKGRPKELKRELDEVLSYDPTS
jgi:CheY-like chemotaxis protein